MRDPHAFTLIELLIVVAIIAILAAIAVPNFLEAQVRAKVSRVYGELRTLATAYEAYKVDRNRYPREYDVRYGDRLYYGEQVVGRNGWWITTPIAYVTNAFLIDPFVPHNTQKFEQLYLYQNLVDRAENRAKGRGPTFSQSFTDLAIPFYGDWRAGSYGPDKQFGDGVTVNSGQMTYDATNGTISAGEIWRCQARGENTQPPAGDPGLLGPH
jgi:prepilin-type N-terminal cleavage/methylation domain-containing protein